MKKTVLVTGAAGFIGSSTAARLHELGYVVVGVDNLSPYYDIDLKKKRVKHFFNDEMVFIQLDLLNIAALKNLFQKYDFDSVVHLAAQPGVRYSIEKPTSYVRANVEATTNVFDVVAKDKKQHIVYASSSSVYGNSSQEKFKEIDDVDDPVSMYAATKRATEIMAKTYNNLYGLNITALRFFTVYGPWGRPDMSPMIFAKKIVSGENIPLFNEGKMERGFTFIDDIVDGVVAAVEKKLLGVEIINLSAKESVDLFTYVRYLEEAFGKKANIELLSMQPGDVYRTEADISKAQELLDYAPSMALKEGLTFFANWYYEYYGL